ncbi:LPS export ABC transporter periplasmic protein LptC [Marinivivus vitaminiproducens]|uniref:LPS export ABC transporter periplasmic protein LptC n=1 Tax=Marinivivus vitaminiproducens TaxID=3035935 RepID=UPI0027A1B015|nr:LPS export ABC transporter periplasmic protein LptC [Geminicoccaceae bacterium SCSIO 64248]
MAIGKHEPERSARAHRPSRFVRFLRWALPSGVIGSLLLLALWPQLFTMTDLPVRIAVDQAQRAAAEALSMRNPSYTGTTGRDVPYAVRAESATLEPGQPERVRLRGITAELDDERAWQLNAVGAIFNTDTREIALDGGITLHSADGYALNTQSAAVDLRNGRVSGDQRVDGRGPGGTVAADRFEVEDSGTRMEFEGRVRVVLQPGQAAGTLADTAVQERAF